MLEGLEISIVNYSDVVANDVFRFDSDFFKKTYLQQQAIVRSLSKATLESLGTQLRSFGAYSLNNEVTYLTEGVPFIRGVNMKRGFVNFDDLIFISPQANALLWKSEIKPKTVLVSMSGSIGEVAIASDSWNYPINSNQDIAKIQVSSQLNPFYLYAFFLSKFGQNYLKREARGSVQQHVFLSQIANFEIPLLAKAFQLKIQQSVELSELTRQTALRKQNDANQHLLANLSMSNWKTPEPLSYVRTSGDVFSAGRLDAEHFQPKFSALLEHLKKTGNAVPLESLLAVCQRGKQPIYADAGYTVVNSKHINNGAVTVDGDNRLASAADGSLYIEPGDVVVNGTGVGTIGRAAAFLHKTKAVPDNHVTILRPKADGIDPVYLAVYLNSLAGQMQVAQRLHGSSGQIELYPVDLAQFTVWVAPKDVQDKIRNAVKDSFAGLQRATQLLDAAKRAVEIAIEQSEVAALAYLNAITDPAGK